MPFEHAVVLVIGTILTTIVSGVCAYMVKSIKKFYSGQKLTHEVLCSVLRGNIVRLHQNYGKSEHIPKEIFDACCDYYEQYKKLGGNGFIDKMFDDLKRLKLSE
ncbi:MAG: hypothetical protein LBC65_03565 [Oscillospiraceae bacterium]|jgi:hypothetical protein|nr:hypothetical protein [Oscillospiraceae bacterium]